MVSMPCIIGSGAGRRPSTAVRSVGPSSDGMKAWAFALHAINDTSRSPRLVLVGLDLLALHLAVGGGGEGLLAAVGGGIEGFLRQVERRHAREGVLGAGQAALVGGVGAALV